MNKDPKTAMKNEVPFVYREISIQGWFVSLPRQLRALRTEWQHPVTIEVTAEPDSAALERMLESRSPITSLWVQLGQLYAEFRDPPERVKLTARPDPSALDGLIEQHSPLASIVFQARSIIGDRRHPSEFQPTAEPIKTPSIWSERRTAIPSSFSAGAHLLVIALIFSGLSFSRDPVLSVQETFVPLYFPVDLMILPADEEDSAGGGGGGKQTLTAPSLGEAPRAADEQFVPPTAEPPVNRNPLLIAEPTIVAPQLASLIPITLPILGDPMAGIPAPPSSGPGVGGGIGTGQGRGVGEGDGPGLGPGEGGGFGGGVFEVGGGVTPPSVLFRTDPVYSEDARKARYQGTVVLEAIVRKDGSVEILRVVRSLGLGLDENAMKALQEWKFKPAMRQGVPVDVAMNIEINFTLR